MFRKSCSIIVGLMVCLTLLSSWMAPSAQSQSNIARVTITDIVAEDRSGEHPLITTYVSVLDNEGQHVSGLSSRDFTVEEFTERVSEISVSPERQGVAVELLVDVSGSMEGRGMSPGGNKLEDVQDANSQFMESLQAEDLAGIFTFSKVVEQVQPLASDRGRESEFVVPTDPALQYTCLYDAMWEAIEDLTGGEEERGDEFARMKKAIFIFSDGLDSGLSACRYELTDVKKLLIARDPKGNISVYAVGVGPEEGDNFSDLRNLADITEGEFIHYFGERADAQGELNGAFDRFLTQGEQYVIRYGTEACADQMTLRVTVGGRSDEEDIQIPPVFPIIRLSDVEQGQRFSGIVELEPEFVLEQCPIREVHYYVSGEKAGTFAPPFTWKWDTSTLPDNPNVGPVEVDAQGNGVIRNVAVRVVAVDQKGYSAEDEVSGLEVEILHPQVEILDPVVDPAVGVCRIERAGRWRAELEETTPNELPVQIELTWPGQRRAIERVEYYLDGEQVATTTSLDQFKLDISALGTVDKEVEEIQYALKVRVVDELGLFAEAQVPLSVGVDIQTFGDILLGLFRSNVMGLVAIVIALVTLILFLRSPKKAIEAVGGGIRKVTEFLGIATKGTRLVLIENGKDGRPYALYDVTNVGRDETKVDIAFDHPRISRLHATLVNEDGQFVLYDQGSKNGTWVNEKRLPFKGQRALVNGDIVDLGQGGIRLRFEMEGGAADEKEGRNNNG
ncbi:MAG: FHA domain-containing protein [Chloroflexota bacterium]|nr:FHA domain-containing protein [Chloroflexota bacterium]